MELDLDLLHHQLETSPNDQETLNQLIAFYQSEQANEELTELYLGQLEAQTENRLPLYRGLAELMEFSLDLREDARVVVIEGLEEFPDDEALWSQLKRLSDTDEQLLIYLEKAKRAISQHPQEQLCADLMALGDDLSPEEQSELLKGVCAYTLKTKATTLAEEFINQFLSANKEPQANLLEGLIDLSIELGSYGLLSQIGTLISVCEEDVITQFVSAVRNLAISHGDVTQIKILTSLLESENEHLKVTALKAVLHSSVTLNNATYSGEMLAYESAYDDDEFSQILTLVFSESSEVTSNESANDLARLGEALSGDRKAQFLERISQVMVESGSLSDLIELLGQQEELDDDTRVGIKGQIAELVQRELTISNLNRLLEVAKHWDRSDFANILADLFFSDSASQEIQETVENWLMANARKETLDAFIDRYIASADDFDAVSLLLRRRASACELRGEPWEEQRGWRERSLALNPSETGMFDYFQGDRLFDRRDQEFLSRLVNDEQTDPRLGLQIVLKAVDKRTDESLLDNWSRLIETAYRRSQRYDADHQKAIEFLKNNEKRELAATLIQESTAFESNEVIKRSLFLDAGDLLKDTIPREAARCYYKALESKNDDRVILSKLLDAYQSAQEWSKSVKVIKKLASLATDGPMRGKYLYAMGVIERDKIGDHTSAVRAFDKALDADPTMVKAIQAIDEVITDDQDYERQDRYYRKCLTRAMTHNVDSRVIYQLAQNLATLNLTKIGNDDAAVQALKVARAHTQKAGKIDQQLLSLYRSKGELENALELHYQELTLNPEKILHYKELLITLRSFGFHQSATLVKNTLKALGHSVEANESSDGRGPSKDMMHFTQQMWELITPTTMNQTINEVFSVLSSAITKTYALADNAYSFSRPEPLGPSTIPPVFMAVASRLRLPLPMVWFSTESAPIAQVHRTNPALVLGPAIDQLTAVDQKFLAARMLFLAKPAYFLATHPSPFEERVTHVRDLFNGCIQLTQTGKFEFKDVPLVRRALSLLDTKDVLGLTQILADSTPISADDVKTWLRSVELLALRLGFTLVGDVETVLQQLQGGLQTISDLSSSALVTDLLQFSVSRSYLAICGDLPAKPRQ